MLSEGLESALRAHWVLKRVDVQYGSTVRLLGIAQVRTCAQCIMTDKSSDLGDAHRSLKVEQYCTYTLFSTQWARGADSRPSLSTFSADNSRTALSCAR